MAYCCAVAMESDAKYMTTPTKTTVMLGMLFDHLLTMLDSDQYPISATIYTKDGKIVTVSVDKRNDDSISDTELGTAIADAKQAQFTHENIDQALDTLLEVLAKRHDNT